VNGFVIKEINNSCWNCSGRTRWLFQSENGGISIVLRETPRLFNDDGILLGDEK